MSFGFSDSDDDDFQSASESAAGPSTKVDKRSTELDRYDLLRRLERVESIQNLVKEKSGDQSATQSSSGRKQKLDSRKSCSLQNKKLKMSAKSAPRGDREYKSTPVEGRVLIKTFILLPCMGTVKKPKPADLNDLQLQGLGEQDIQFNLTNTRDDIFEKIQRAFPLLAGLRGGLKWMKASGNSNSLDALLIQNRMVSGLSGRELKEVACGAIYLTPLQEDLDVPEQEAESVECIFCFEKFSLYEIEAHADVCADIFQDPPQASSGARAVAAQASCNSRYKQSLPNGSYALPTVSQAGTSAEGTSGTNAQPRRSKRIMARKSASGRRVPLLEWAAALEVMRRFTLDVIDQSSTDVEADLNSIIRIKRGNFVFDADRLASKKDFLEILRKRLVVRYVGEEHLDDVKNSFVSSAIDFYVSVLKSATYDCPPDNILHRHEFAAGVFFGIGMVHCGMFHKFMLSYHDKIREEDALESDEHPFIRGLNTLGVADLLVTQPDIRCLFWQDEKTASHIFSRLKINEFMTPREKESLFFFSSFLTNVENGSLTGAETGFQLNVDTVYKWITGSSVKISNGDDIEVLFHPTCDDTAVPRPVVKTGHPGSLKLPVVDSYETMELVCCEAVESAAHGFTLV